MLKKLIFLNKKLKTKLEVVFSFISFFFKFIKQAVNHLIIKKKVKNIFKNFNLNNNHAGISAEYLIKAELVGASSHGLSRLKMYCERIKKKIINPKPKIKIKKI